MTSMPSYSKNDVVLLRYPFSESAEAKVRPAVVVSAPHSSRDVFVVPLTSRVASLSAGEFALEAWARAGLNVPTAVKRGLYTIHESLITKRLGTLGAPDAIRLQASLRQWLGL